MSKWKQLLKVSMLNSFGINQALHSKDRKERAKLAGFGVLFGFVALSMLFIFFFYSYSLAYSLEQMQASLRILPAIMMALCCAISLVTTIFKTNGLLFAFHDYDILMAMPIKTSTIVASRIFMLYGTNLFFNAMVMIPAIAVYCIKVQPSFLFYPVFLLTLLAIPLVPIVAATFIGIMVSLIASRFRHSSVVSVAVTMLLLLGCMALSFQTETLLSDLGNISITIMASVNRIYPLTELFTQAVCDQNLLSLLLFAGVSGLLFFLYCLLVGSQFKKINTILTSRKSSSHYQVQYLKVSTPLCALYRKEWKRYLSCSIYFINTVFGAVLMIVACVLLLIFDPNTLVQQIPGVDLLPLLKSIVPFAFCLLVGMSCSSCSSISLEGNSLWIIKSMPVSATAIFLSKAAVNLTFLLPSIAVSTVLMSIALHLDVWQTLALFFLPAAYSLFISLFGLLANLFFPNFTWKAEVNVVKQSVPVLICLLVGMLGAFLSAAPVFLFSSVSPSLLAGLAAVFFLLLSLLIWRILRIKGTQLLRSM